TLLSPAGKLRTALEPLVTRRLATDAHADADESAGAFFRRRFGAEFARRIAQPLLGGIHAGDLDRLSAQAVVPQLVAMEQAGRSVLLTLRAQSRRPREGGAFRSFRDGMITLVDEMHRQLRAGVVRLGDGAIAVADTPTGWRVTTSSGSDVDSELLLLAAPAPIVAGWLRPLSPQVADLAAGIRYVSSAGVLSAYHSTAIARPLRGSGYVSTKDGSERLLATSWLTGKWAGRAPAGFTLLRGFYGGAYDEGVLDSTDEALIEDAHASWARRFGIAGRPRFSRVVRWPATSPQHEVGHLSRVATIDEVLTGLGGIAVAGSGFRAVGIPDVVSDSRHAVRRLLEAWRAR
ncbi:MAG TPA: protoporphyrinogen oxidase, partial [Luteitalea sp.]|nr:protoporphyrinogen oxidase [Luteitalea sp.]